jgi:hypothetical protein
MWLFFIFNFLPQEDNKFYILDGTKHDPEKFSILHFITSK